MKVNGVFAGVVLCAFGLFAASGVRAQVTREGLDAVGLRLQAAQSFYNKLSPQQQKMLSGSALNFFHVVKEWPELQGRALQIQKALGSGQLPSANVSSQLSLTDVPTTLSPVRVSNPATDFKYGLSGGFTQSETSSAWCGTHVVVGFNDSGSFWQSGFATNGANLSVNGFALSTTTGTTTYKDEGYLPANVSGSAVNFLLGDPVLACTSTLNFYYSSLLQSTSAIGAPLSDISVSLSTNGGTSFGAPIIAVAKNGRTHFLDKDWMAVNPANPSQIAMTYTDFDSSGSICGFTNGLANLRVAIELVGSANGGATWSAPTVLNQQCNRPRLPSRIFSVGSGQCGLRAVLSGPSDRASNSV